MTMRRSAPGVVCGPHQNDHPRVALM
jgi:hypothetical protein